MSPWISVRATRRATSGSSSQISHWKPLSVTTQDPLHPHNDQPYGLFGLVVLGVCTWLVVPTAHCRNLPIRGSATPTSDMFHLSEQEYLGEAPQILHSPHKYHRIISEAWLWVHQHHANHKIRTSPFDSDTVNSTP
ncbi:hypothetical protein BDZ94DRAFT_1248241 [Collybia nuda]|uniref:Uncharacterized protein n=1 Tax=Collybia nuda TaxID=64659 RepID=A0A9P5YCD9_9AGAR|nr:hypothetical protein BDZ94DRAFT_1248241 [Collybia nuda]